MKKILLILISSILVVSTPCFACWGNRPLAMGGAFTGLADDINAVYWNPAGLALSKRGVTTMHNAGDKNDSNYDQYTGLALPMKSYGTFGAAYVYNKDILRYTNGQNYGYIKDAYYQVGYGINLQKQLKLDISIGANFKVVTKHKKTTNSNTNEDWSDFDLGALWRFGENLGRTKMFSLGFLLQNASEAQLIKRNSSAKMARNFRPGFAFHPDTQSTFSIELYDAFGATSGSRNDVSYDLRFGAERWLFEIIAIRAGGYHVNNSKLKAYTGGIGIKMPDDWKLDLELDWTVMYWDNLKQATNFIGITYLF